MQASDFNQSKCDLFEINSSFNKCRYYADADDARANGFCVKENMYRCVATDGKVIPLSHSSVQDFLTCHHLYYLKAIRGIQTKNPAKSAALKMGKLWDSALQKYLGGKLVDDSGKPTSMSDIIAAYEIDDIEVAKVKALYDAYRELEITIDPDYELQARINNSISFDKQWHDGVPVELLLTGFYDRKYSNYFAENKLSGRPDMYLDTYFIQSQIGTYFLADPKLEYCIMEVVRVPQLKQTGKTQDESIEDYYKRTYQDILTRPAFYFLGWDNKKKRYGKKYYRTEFNLDEIKSRYLHIFREIFDARITDGWYKNDKACNNVLPGIPCDMLGICKLGNNFNESIYEVRPKKIAF